MKKKALQNVKTNLTYPNTHKRRGWSRAAALNANARTRTRRKRRAWCGTRDRVAKLLFLLSTPMRTLPPPSLTHEARRPAGPSVVFLYYYYYYYYYVVASSSSKHAPCCGRFPVALLPVGVFFHVCVLKDGVVCVGSHAYRSKRVFSSFPLVRLKVTSLVVVVVVVVLFASSSFFRDFFRVFLRFRGRSSTVSSMRPLRIASSARTQTSGKSSRCSSTRNPTTTPAVRSREK